MSQEAPSAPPPTPASAPSSAAAEPAAPAAAPNAEPAPAAAPTVPGAVKLFEKTLTSSDGNGQGRIVIPKAHAEAHLPSLDKQNGLEVPVKDSHGTPHKLRFRFWINNQSRMYLLEGTQAIQRAYGLSVGDVMTFSRLPDGGLMVSGRKGTRADQQRKPVERTKNANKPPQGAKGDKPPRKRKRQALQDLGQVTDAGHAMFQPLKDGVFRAVPDGLSTEAAGKVEHKDGSWIATLNLAGELYQAFFDTQDAAVEAFNAAGGSG